ncbi:MAG: hypothetical protein E5299_01740 [Burkholderia gladioli]|nr:MAG: hypothetical protein E5299_01740 [Burkholderia gladioli]
MHTNLSRTGACDICKRYAHESAARLRDKPSGGAVSGQQEVEIRMLLYDQMPDKLKMSFALWTRRHAVRELIRQRCGFTLTLPGVALLHKSSVRTQEHRRVY